LRTGGWLFATGNWQLAIDLIMTKKLIHTTKLPKEKSNEKHISG